MSEQINVPFNPLSAKVSLRFRLTVYEYLFLLPWPPLPQNGKNAAKAATDLHYPAVTAEFQGCVLFNVREIIVPAGSCCFFKVGGTILMACLHGGNLKNKGGESDSPPYR